MIINPQIISGLAVTTLKQIEKKIVFIKIKIKKIIINRLSVLNTSEVGKKTEIRSKWFFRMR